MRQRDFGADRALASNPHQVIISEARAASFYQGTTSSSTPSMAKIQPLPATSSADECQNPQLQKQAAYTVWMKSLVFNGNGCTVYGADGSLAFRVDNYGCRGGREVFFMDRAGNTLIRIRRKSFGVFKRWEAFRYVNDGEEKPWFRVQKVQKNGAAVKMHGSGRTYGIHGCSCKSDYKISGAYGEVVAAVERKQTASRGSIRGLSAANLHETPKLLVGLALSVKIDASCDHLAELEANSIFQMHVHFTHPTSSREIMIGKMHGSGRTYGIGGCSCKSDYKISGADGEVVAAVERKQTASGVIFGEDVLTLTVGSEVDQFLVLGLVVGRVRPHPS
ncbi:hypothetical protein EJB05_16503, partial [Eragrostis curvula]